MITLGTCFDWKKSTPLIAFGAVGALPSSIAQKTPQKDTLLPYEIFNIGRIKRNLQLTLVQPNQ